jgi:hypothetical protein
VSGSAGAAPPGGRGPDAAGLPTNARCLEPTIQLLVKLAYGQGLGAGIG